MEEKYRKVKLQNAAFQKRLGGLQGGDQAMKAVGFIVEQQDGNQVYQLHASPDAWPKLMAAKATVEQAVSSAELVATPATTLNSSYGTGIPAGLSPNMGGGMSAAAMNDPRMQSAMAEVMNNPEALRNMLQVSSKLLVFLNNVTRFLSSLRLLQLVHASVGDDWIKKVEQRKNRRKSTETQ